MFNKILIANRGEIALRVVRACKEMGIKTVVVYSKADESSLAVRFADEAVCIGPAPSDQSYLLIDRIISVAEICDVEAIHPGYGFLAENYQFAEICNRCNIKFIGPSPAQMKAMGDKAMARETMRKAGVPITPGSGIITSNEEALDAAHNLGYPVIIKASAGGGGRGMRIAHNDNALVKVLHEAKREAKNAFGNDDVYMEKFIENPKHIEVQILADKAGNIIHLGERDCSMQRRNQKMIEESPAPSVSPSTRKKLYEAAIKAAKAVRYTSAGTVEFLLAPNGKFYFMEMNTRIQVEHTVSEMVSGIDIVKEQIRIAADEQLTIQQKDVQLTGHAIECRINAEDPMRSFAPCPGTVDFFCPPGGPGVRIDSHVYNGYTIPQYYDSMIGKLIVHAPTRKEAIARCKSALEQFIIHGVATTIPFEQYLLNSHVFSDGTYNTGFIDKIMKEHAFEQQQKAQADGNRTLPAAK